MMSVRVVFADGSTQMAHNLDDQRERWYLRKEAELTEIQKESQEGYAIPLITLSAISSPDAVHQLRRALTKRITALDARLTLLNSHKQRTDLKHVRTHLSFVRTTVQEDIIQLNEALKAFGHLEGDHAAASKIKKLQKYARQLEQKLVANGIELPEKPFEWWNQAS